MCNLLIIHDHYYYNIAPKFSEDAMQSGPIKKSKLCIQRHTGKSLVLLSGWSPLFC